METFTMDKAKLQELANEFAKGLKTQHDLNDFTKMQSSLVKHRLDSRVNLLSSFDLLFIKFMFPLIALVALSTFSALSGKS